MLLHWVIMHCNFWRALIYMHDNNKIILMPTYEQNYQWDSITQRSNPRTQWPSKKSNIFKETKGMIVIYLHHPKVSFENLQTIVKEHTEITQPYGPNSPKFWSHPVRRGSTMNNEELECGIAINNGLKHITETCKTLELIKYTSVTKRGEIFFYVLKFELSRGKIMLYDLLQWERNN